MGMLAALPAGPGWTGHRVVCPSAAFAWSGWHAPRLEGRNGFLVALDGAIYNRDGFGSFESDAALVAALYEHDNFEGMLRRLNGDFAVALYDQRADTLWLGRDRFGVKPLYYVSRPESCAFASRPRALFGLPGVSTEVNRRYVALFAAAHYRYIDNEPGESPYAHIAQLPAAHWLRAQEGRLAMGRYWALEEMPDHTGSEEELAEEYRELFLDAVGMRVKSAHRPSYTLSGGMDSSSVLASSAHLTDQPQEAISAVYTDPTYDEAEDIQDMIQAYVSRWHTVRVDEPDVLPLVTSMIEAHDEPVATATWLSHYLLCREARVQELGGLFGGLGGDELNAGEYEYFPYFFADLKAAGRDAEFRNEVERWVAHHDHPVYRKTLLAAEDGIARLVDLSVPGLCLPDRLRLLRYASALNRDYFDIESFQPAMEHPFRTYMKNRAYQDLSREALPCCLRAEDRQTTAFRLDCLHPFLDHRLAEFMFRVPGTLQIRGGVTKILLREAMKGILPEGTRTRIKKTGWNAPAHRWFVGRGLDNVRDLILSRSFRERGIYNPTEVDRILDEHEAIVTSGDHKENHMMFIWQLVNLELWFQSIENGR